MREALIFANIAGPLAAGGLAWLGAGGWALALLFCIHASTFWATLWPRCRWWGPQINSFPTTKKEVWLTLDDGPDPEDTPFLLDALDAAGAKAIFFLIGEKARAYPDLVAAIAARGHLVGNHTFTHPQSTFWLAGPRRTFHEVTVTQNLLHDLTGSAPAWFRAPAGFKNGFLHPVLRRQGLHLMGWSARGLDGRDTHRERIVARVLKRLRPGAILLLHEGKRDAAGHSLARDTVPQVLAALRQQGYQCVLPTIPP